MGKVVRIIRRFKGKIDWNIIRGVLASFVGKVIKVKETNESIKIDKKFIKEFASSVYTQKSNQTIKKIKANISPFIKELIESAGHANDEANNESKHNFDARKGWKKYRAMFEIELNINGTNELVMQRYSCIIVVRCPNRKEMYLYDITNIKKEADKS